MRTIIFVIALLGLVPHGYAAGMSVRQVQLVPSDQRVLVVVDMDGEPSYKLSTLNAPDRLVINLKNARWAAERVMVPASLQGKVKGLRHAPYDSSTLRLVADLARPYHIGKYYVLPPAKKGMHTKLVVELNAGAGVAAPAPSRAPVKPFALSYEAKAPEKSSESALQRAAEAVPASMRGKTSALSNLKTTADLRAEANGVVPVAKPSAAPPKIRRMVLPTIVIDAGHGGKDTGAVGQRGTREKDLTLAYAKALRDQLQATGRFNVLLTRSSDIYIPLSDRVRKASALKGSLFISLHCDSHSDKSIRGFSVYTISENRSDREGMKLLKAAKDREVLRGVDMRRESKDVQQTLIDLAQRDSKNTASRFAKILINQMGGSAKQLRNTHREASFAVLTGADIPSVLVEMGYISNKEDERLFKTAEYKQKLAKKMANAIDIYFEKERVTR